MQCDNSPRKHAKQSSSTFDSLLLCCHDDMCNHDMADNKKLKPNLTSENSDGKFLIAYFFVNIRGRHAINPFQFILLSLNCYLLQLKKLSNK